jgi:uncharacterized membrane protein
MLVKFRRSRRGKNGRAVRAIRRLAAFAVLLALVAYSILGTFSPCVVLRETARRANGLAALLPDDILDQVIEAQYGALSPGRCVGIMLSNQNIPAIATNRFPK